MDAVTQLVIGAAAGQLVGGRGWIDLWREVAGQDRRHVPLPAIDRPLPGAT